MSVEFLDTNVLVYAHDRTAGDKQRIAADLVRRLVDSGDGPLSIQVLAEFFVTVTRKILDPLPAARAEEVVRDFATWRVHCPAAADLLDAIRMSRVHGISFWDAMILRSAQALGATVAWSEDLTHGRVYDGVEVRNPFL